jgi:MFS family permease
MAMSGHQGRASDGARRLLVFGFALTFLSGFGQTFFIGLFGAEIRATSGISDALFGTTYSAATLLAALCMVWAGALIDRLPLSRYVMASTVLVAAGCLLVVVANHVLWLGVALFLLRFAGQGLLAHTSVTSVARFAGGRRGRSLGLTQLGHPAGEAAFPPLAMVVAAALGWRSVWLLAAGLVVAAAPLLMRLGSGFRVSEEPAGPAGERAAVVVPVPPRRSMLRDRRFYLLVPTLLLPAFVITGLFFHQARLVADKGWPGPWIANLFVVFAAAQTLAMLGVGPLIDRLQARRLLPLYLLPLAIACVLVNATDQQWIGVPVMFGAGLTLGAAAAIVTSMWVEMYGVEGLGANRALGSSISVVGAGLAPAIFGWAIELGAAVDTILLGCAGLLAAAAALAFVVTRSAAR